MKELTINDQNKAKQSLKRPKTTESIRQKTGTVFNEDITKVDYSQI